VGTILADERFSVRTSQKTDSALKKSKLVCLIHLALDMLILQILFLFGSLKKKLNRSREFQRNEYGQTGLIKITGN